MGVGVLCVSSENLFMASNISVDIGYYFFFWQSLKTRDASWNFPAVKTMWALEHRKKWTCCIPIA